MAQLTFQKDPRTQADITTAKQFFGTQSEAAAVRSALALSQQLARTAKDRTIILRDLNRGGYLRIVCK